MASSDEFDSFAFDEADLAQIDALSIPQRPPVPIASSSKQHLYPNLSARPIPSRTYTNLSHLRPPDSPPPSSLYSDDMSLEITPELMMEIDQTMATGVGTAPRLNQMNLFGERAQGTSYEGSSQGLVRKEGKRWDRTEFAKYGARKGKGKGKAKRGFEEDEDEEEEEEAESGFDQFPAPMVQRESLGSWLSLCC